MASGDSDKFEMAQKMQEIKHELEMMKLQHEIDTLQREIDTSMPRRYASTPFVDGRSVTFDLPYEPSRLAEEKYQPGMTPFPRVMPQKPRRLLPKTPPQVRQEMSIHKGCQTDIAYGSPVQHVPERHKEPSEATGQTVDTAQSGKYGSSRSILMKPATYEGSNPWTDYKAHFDACAALNHWDDEQKGLYLSVSLRGQAQGVFGNLQAGSNGYASLVQALEERFAPPNQTELYRVQLKSRQQRATESMAELGQDIRRLTNLAYPSAPNDVRETLAKEQFMDALVSADMRLKVKQSRPKDLNDAVRHAVELESFYRAEKRQQGLVCSTVPDAEPSTDVGMLQQTLNQVQETLQHMNRERQRVDHQSTKQTDYRSPMGKRQPEGQGYAGNKYGQQQRWNTQNSGQRRTDGRAYSSNRTSLKCFECGSEKHFIRDCPRLRDQGNPPKHIQSNNHNYNQSGLTSSAGLYARAQIDGVSVDCLVDTGATLTLISYKLWELIQDKHTLTNFSTPIISASGDAIKVQGRTEVLIEFGDMRCPVKVIVADMDIDMVLGIDFMKSYSVSIDVMTDTMTARGKYIPLSCVGKVDCGRNKVGQSIHCDRIRRCKEQILLGENDSDLENLEVESVNDIGDEPSFSQEHDCDMHDARVRKKPVWAKDYIFSTFKGKMPMTKITPRKMPPGVCSCCAETITGDLTEHIKACPKRLPCHLCKKTFLKTAYLKKHLADTHKNVAEGATQKEIHEGWNVDPDIHLGDDEDSVNSENEEDVQIISESAQLSETNESLAQKPSTSGTVQDHQETVSSAHYSCTENDEGGILTGRIFRKPTVPQLPRGKRTQAQIMSQQERPGASKRPVSATVVGEKTADTTVQKKQRVEERDTPKKKISIECEGDIRINLGAMMGEDCVLKATDVSVELVNGKLRVEVNY